MWLLWEKQHGSAESVLECRAALRRFVPKGLEEKAAQAVV
jgi:hypothetical protein